MVHSTHRLTNEEVQFNSKFSDLVTGVEIFSTLFQVLYKETQLCGRNSARVGLFSKFDSLWREMRSMPLNGKKKWCQNSL